MDDARSTDEKRRTSSPYGAPVSSAWIFLTCLISGGFISLITLGPMSPGIQKAQENAYVQQSRTIDLALYQYAQDHAGKYPEGKSSTEVFQKLLDEKYVTDPSIFYALLPGKTKPIEGEQLKPENVSWDVTCCLDQNSSDELPVVFFTGYKITYTPGSAALPLIKPYPHFGMEYQRTWFLWLQGWGDGIDPGLVVTYKDNRAYFRKFDSSTESIPNFIPPDFDAKGKTYRQLTPDGPLP